MRDDDLGALLPEAVSPASPSTPVGIVVSHSCDLAHPDETAEPFAEIILGHSTDGVLDPSEIGGLTHGKNPRRLYLELHSHPSGAEWLEFRPYMVHRAARESLKELEPDDQRFLLGEQVRILSTWLAERFQRTALPDTFNDLLKPQQKKLNRIYKRLSPAISAIYIRLSPNGELESDQQYAADLLLTVPVSRAEHLADAREGAERLKELLLRAGIDARAVAKSESDVNLQTVRSMSKLPLDAISLKGDQHPVDAESETDPG